MRDSMETLSGRVSVREESVRERVGKSGTQTGTDGKREQGEEKKEGCVTPDDNVMCFPQ